MVEKLSDLVNTALNNCSISLIQKITLIKLRNDKNLFKGLKQIKSIYSEQG